MPDGNKVTGGSPRKAGALDVRSVIAALLGLYGVIVLLTGFFTSDDDLAKSGDLNINIWTGVGMLVAAALFQLWATLRPIVVPEDFEADE